MNGLVGVGFGCVAVILAFIGTEIVADRFDLSYPQSICIWIPQLLCWWTISAILYYYFFVLGGN